MSRQNKVNPDHYTTGGRLTPDDLARERWKQNEPAHAERGRRAKKAMPPWLSDQARNKSAATRGAADEDQTEVQEPETPRPAEPKESGAGGTPQTRKAPRVRATPQKAARRAASTSKAAARRGTKKRTASKGAAKKKRPA